MAETQPLHLNDKHLALDARMGEEAGFSVPLSYASALDEAGEASARAGVCDVSDLTRLRIRGDGALDLLDRLCSCDVARQEDDTARLTCICNGRGGIVDCGYLVRLDNAWLLTGNSGNREKLLGAARLLADDEGHKVKIDDLTGKTCQFSITGPRAASLLDAILPEPVSAMPPGAVRVGNYLVAKIYAMRTGHGPFWSMEAIVPNMLAGQGWELLTRRAKDNAIAPMGRAARDILRVEAGLPRYGHEIHEMIDPISSGLSRAVSLDHDFVGAEAIGKIVARGPARRLVSLSFKGATPATALPRLGTPIVSPEGDEVGAVTSGTYSPVSGGPIALAYVNASLARPDATVRVELVPAGQALPYQNARITKVHL